MILSRADFETGIKAERRTKNVAVPNFCNGHFGKDAELLVTEMTVKGFMRYSELQKKIIERKLPQDVTAGLFMCASLISCIIDDTGDFFFNEDQLDWFYDNVDKKTLEDLLIAHGELNPPSPDKTFNTKKKKS